MDPIHITTSVSIYSTPSGKYPAFTVCWRFHGRRVRKKFSDLKQAEAFAQARASSIADGRASAASLSWDQCQEYTAAKRLNPGVSLVTIAEDYQRRNGKARAYTVQQAVADLLQFKRGLVRRRPYHHNYLRNLESTLEHFAECFPCDLGRVTADQLQTWLNGLPGSLRTKNNYHDNIRALVRFAIRQRKLPADFDEHARVVLQRAGPGAIHVYTPEEAKTILRYCQRKARRWLPFIPLRMFSGIRAEECLRLRKRHFHGVKWISADQDVTKTERRRLIPVLANLAQWLKRYPPKEPLLPFDSYDDLSPRLSETIAAAGVQTRHNGFRDTFASFRLAALQDAAKVSEETGHSVEQLRRSYREIRLPDGRIITPKMAALYFALSP